MSDVVEIQIKEQRVKVSVNNIEDALLATSYRAKFRRLCRQKTEAVLSPYLGHGSSTIDEITDDAIGLANERTLKWVRKLPENRVAEILHDFNPDENDIRAYLYTIVLREAFKRYRRWNSGKKSGKQGYAARTELTVNDNDDVEEAVFDEWVIEKNKELFPLNNRTDFKSISLVDILTEKGISEDVIDYIRLKIIGGVTYEELSKEYNQSESKYAKAIDRALKKAQLK
jgi:DNA-directed RNA polymerase specialized sigma24 family protein